MILKKQVKYRLFYLLSDFLMTALSLLMISLILLSSLQALFGLNIGMVLLVCFMVYWLSGYYNKPCAKSRLLDFTTTLLTSLIIGFILFFLFIEQDQQHEFNSHFNVFIYISLIFFILLYIGRSVITYDFLFNKSKKINRRRILLIKEGAYGEEMAQWLESIAKLNLVKQITFDPSLTTSNESIQTFVNQLKNDITAEEIEELVISVENYTIKDLSPLLYQLYPIKVSIKVSPHHLQLRDVKLNYNAVDGNLLLSLSEANMSQAAQNIKWLFDRALSALLLIVLSPLYIIIAYYVKKSSAGAIIYKQERIGYLGKPFTLYKFRTMYEDAEANGPQLSCKNDSRVTKFGKFLRRYRLDEQPELWNVLKGDMSFVGPTPERACYIEQIIKNMPEFVLLHNVKPGMTNWGLVHYGYASSLEEIKERLNYDWLYYNSISLRLDILILVYTLKMILKGAGK